MESKPTPSAERLGAFQLVLLALSLLVLTGLAADTFLALPPAISRIFHVVDTAVCGFLERDASKCPHGHVMRHLRAG